MKRKLFIGNDFEDAKNELKLMKKEISLVDDFPHEILKEIIKVLLDNGTRTINEWKSYKFVCKKFYSICNDLLSLTIHIIDPLNLIKFPMNFPKNQYLSLNISDDVAEALLHQTLEWNDNFNVDKLKLKYFGSSINLYKIIKHFKSISELDVTMHSTNTFQNFDWEKLKKFENLSILKINTSKQNPHVPICNMDLTQTKLKKLYILASIPQPHLFLNLPTTLEILHGPNIKHIHGNTQKLKELVFRRNLKGDNCMLSWNGIRKDTLKKLCIGIHNLINLFNVNESFKSLEELVISIVSNSFFDESGHLLQMIPLSNLPKLNSLTLILMYQTTNINLFASPSVKILTIISNKKNSISFEWKKIFPNLEKFILYQPYLSIYKMVSITMDKRMDMDKINTSYLDLQPCHNPKISEYIYNENSKYWLMNKAELF